MSKKTKHTYIYNGHFTNTYGDTILVEVVSLDTPLNRGQENDVMDLLENKTTWFTDGYTGEHWGYANIKQVESLNGLSFNKIELHNALWGIRDGQETIIRAKIYAELC